MASKGFISPLKIIRAHCLECSGGSRSEADNCTVTKCLLHPLRLGKNPSKKLRVLTEEQRELLSQRGKALAANRKQQSIGK